MEEERSNALEMEEEEAQETEEGAEEESRRALISFVTVQYSRWSRSSSRLSP